MFWSDPSADFPTSAVCWNAGVECIGDPSQYDTCDPVNKDVTGNSHVSDAQAVLQPMSRYIGLLDAIEQEKQQFSADQEIIVALIGGVDSSGQPFYADVFNTDPEFQNSYGIGPGCTAVNPLDPNEPIRAVPPVRLRDLTEAFTPGNMFSICQGDYSPALQSIADRIRDQIPPACFPECVVDTNPNTPVVEPSCVLTQHAPSQQDDLDIPECLRDANGYVIDPQSDSYAMPSDAANVCFAMLVDKAGQTADPWDDMTNVCVEEGVNLEFKIVRRPGFPAPGGASVSADCVLSGQPALDCPELP